MIRQTLFVITFIALLALGRGHHGSAVAQTLNGSPPPTPDAALEITTMDLLGVNTLIVGWTVKKTGSVTIEP